jgi:hypothetical protein
VRSGSLILNIRTHGRTLSLARTLAGASALECLHYAIECEQLAQTRSDEAIRATLLATSVDWRELANNAAARETGAIPDQYGAARTGLGPKAGRLPTIRKRTKQPV